MVCTFLKVYMELGSPFLFLQEQIKDIIIITTFASRRVGVPHLSPPFRSDRFGIGSQLPPCTLPPRSPSSRHPPGSFTQYPFPPRSLVCGCQPTCSSLGSSCLTFMSSTTLLRPRAKLCIRPCSNKQQQGECSLVQCW
jgi:hypothetical protein